MSTGRPNVHSTPEEVARIALEDTEATYPTLSGKAEVVLARRATEAEAESTGLGHNIPMMLVVLRGDFDVSRFAGGRHLANADRRRAQYITYLFDLRTGTIPFMATSPNEKGLQVVLNDLGRGGMSLPQPTPSHSPDEIAPTKIPPDEPGK